MRRKLFLIVVVLGLTGCFDSWPLRREPEYPAKPHNVLAFHGIEKVAVVILNATDAEVDIREAAQIYSVELQQSHGITVFPAAVARAAILEQKLRLPEQAHVLAKSLGVDAVIVGFITDYQPYDNPRVGVLLMVYPATAEDEPADTAVALVSVNRAYDSDTKEVAEQIRAFAAKRDAAGTALGARKYMLVMSEYMKFVADRSIRDLFNVVGSADARTPTTTGAVETGKVADDETAIDTHQGNMNADEQSHPDVEERNN